jgi:hypothetical protein
MRVTRDLPHDASEINRTLRDALLTIAAIVLTGLLCLAI